MELSTVVFKVVKEDELNKHVLSNSTEINTIEKCYIGRTKRLVKNDVILTTKVFNFIFNCTKDN